MYLKISSEDFDTGGLKSPDQSILHLLNDESDDSSMDALIFPDIFKAAAYISAFSTPLMVLSLE